MKNAFFISITSHREIFLFMVKISKKKDGLKTKAKVKRPDTIVTLQDQALDFLVCDIKGPNSEI